MQSKLIVGSVSSQYNYIWELLGKTEQRSQANELSEYDQLAALANKADLLLIRPSKASLGVEDVQPLFEFAFKRPILGETAFAIILNFELATPQTQNKLLKLLEEPPDYLQIVLCASDERKVLATIKSRCVKIILTPADGSSQRENNIFTAKAAELLTQILRDPKAIYTQLEPFLAEQKENSDKNIFWRELALQMSQRAIEMLEQPASGSAGANLVNYDPAKAKQLLEISSQIHRQAASAVNQKLIADSLYVRLSQ